MKNTLNTLKSLTVLTATLSVVMPFSILHAANYLYFWKASADPSVTAYGIYQRIGDSDYDKIDEVRVQDLDNPSSPSYLATGLEDGNSYWFAATSITSSGTESDHSDQTCITVNGQIVECTDTNDNGSTVFISCFITAAGLRAEKKKPGAWFGIPVDRSLHRSLGSHEAAHCVPD
jgi:hypothetical protein